MTIRANIQPIKLSPQCLDTVWILHHFVQQCSEIAEKRLVTDEYRLRSLVNDKILVFEAVPEMGNDARLAASGFLVVDTIHDRPQLLGYSL
jgi:hypothetical protein